MDNSSKTSTTISKPLSATFRPSWFDRISGFVDRLPLPYWITYALLGVFIYGLGALIKTFDPLQSNTPTNSLSILAVFQIAYVMALMHFLDNLSAKAFDIIRPILWVDEAGQEALKTRLTTMPSRATAVLTTLVLGLFAILGVFLFTDLRPAELPYISAATEFFIRSPFGIFAFIAMTLLWVINAIFMYHTIYQLRTIAAILTQHARINLFRQDELYAFSRVAAGTAIGLVLTSPIWLLLDRGVATFVINLVFSVMAGIIFVTPLLGTHLLLKRQKDQLLRKSMGNKEVLIEDLFSKLEKGKLEDIQLIEGALSGVDLAHANIRRISTWPWQMETVRQIIGAISLPITIWIIQYFLAEVLSP